MALFCGRTMPLGRMGQRYRNSIAIVMAWRGSGTGGFNQVLKSEVKMAPKYNNWIPGITWEGQAVGAMINRCY